MQLGFAVWPATMLDQRDLHTEANGDIDRLYFDEYPRSRLTHYLFRYPAKFHPPVARKLIEEFSGEGDLVLDPFCGSGTLLVEALGVGRSSIGTDIDPVATFVSRVKTLSIPAKSLRQSSDHLLNALNIFERKEYQYEQLMFEDIPADDFEKEMSKRHLSLPQILNFFHWFRRYVALDLATIISQINLVKMPKNHRLFLTLIFASIIRRASNADPVPVSGLEVTAYMRTLEENGRLINPYSLFRKAILRGLKDWEEYQEQRSGSSCTVDVRQADAMRIRRHVRSKVDAIITSPPYHQAVDYYRRHTLEMFWLGLVRDQGDRLRLRARYIGRDGVTRSDPIIKRSAVRSDLAEQWETKLEDRSVARATAFRHYVAAMSKSLDGMAAVLRPGGKAVFVIGKNTTSGGLEIPSTDIFNEIACSRFQLCSTYWYPVKNRYMTYSRRNGANIDKEYVLVYEKKDC